LAIALVRYPDHVAGGAGRWLYMLAVVALALIGLPTWRWVTGRRPPKMT